jgi:hypothetical protein
MGDEHLLRNQAILFRSRRQMSARPAILVRRRRGHDIARSTPGDWKDFAVHQ